MKTTKLDEQAMLEADKYLLSLSAKVDEAVEHIKKQGLDIDIIGEINFRNSIGTMLVKAHLFTATRILVGSGMDNEKIHEYIQKVLDMPYLSDVVEKSVGQVH